MDFSTLFAQLAHFPLDFVIPALIAILFSIETYRSGPGHAVSAVVAIVLAYMLYQWLPSTFIAPVFSALSTPLYVAAFFISIYVSMFVIANRMLYTFNTGGASVTQASICGVAATSIVLVFWIISPGISELWEFGPQIQLVFGESYRAWWLLGGTLALAIVRG